MALLPLEYRRTLEIGCAAGGFSSQLSKEAERWGVEPNVGMAAEAESHLDRVLTGTYLEVETDIPDNYFDLIICNDVIEHMVDHDEFLQRIQIKMTDSAAIIGSVPNIRYYPVLLELLHGKQWQYKDYGVLDRTHLRFFTRDSLESTLECNGFNSIKTDLLNKVTFNNSVWAIKHKLLLGGIACFTLGRANDIRYMQIGFKAVKG
jgi:2-polyprenyl-3-methyl-5-hydroxy-6-metoxy-1,4-benzoquinol methylase